MHQLFKYTYKTENIFFFSFGSLIIILLRWFDTNTTIFKYTYKTGNSFLVPLKIYIEKYFCKTFMSNKISET